MSNKTFAERMVEDRRLAMLRLLAEARGQTLNSSVLHMGLHHLGVLVERHEVIDDLHFLQLHNLIALAPVLTTVYVATLQGRGEDVANGLCQIEGVSRPRRGH